MEVSPQEEKEELHKMLSDVSDAMIHNKDASQSEIKILVAERDVMRQAVEEGSREKEHLEQTLQVLEKELREVKHKLKSEVSSKRALEEQHRTRIAALAEEQSVLQRLNKEASEDVARLHQEKAEDITKREAVVVWWLDMLFDRTRRHIGEMGLVCGWRGVWLAGFHRLIQVTRVLC